MARNLDIAPVSAERYVKAAIWSSAIFTVALAAAAILIVAAVFTPSPAASTLLQWALGSVLLSVLSGLNFYAMKDKVWSLTYTEAPLLSEPTITVVTPK